MMRSLYASMVQLPDIYLYLTISATFVVISILLTILLRRIIPSHIRARDNAIIIGTSNLVSLIYGVLVGLSALYLINNMSYTADAVQHEANAVADVYRYSKYLTEPTKSDIKNKLITYLNSVIHTEWKQMANENEISDENDFLIDAITNDIISHPATGDMQITLQKKTLDNLQNLYNARQQRIHMSYALLNPDLWIVIIVGTLLTLCLNYVVDMNFYLHLITVTSIALMTSSMIFLLIALDGPFQGDFVIDSGAMEYVLQYIEKG